MVPSSLVPQCGDPPKQAPTLIITENCRISPLISHKKNKTCWRIVDNGTKGAGNFITSWYEVPRSFTKDYEVGQFAKTTKFTNNNKVIFQKVLGFCNKKTTYCFPILFIAKGMSLAINGLTKQQIKKNCNINMLGKKSVRYCASIKNINFGPL